MKPNIFLARIYGLTRDEIKNFNTHYQQAQAQNNHAKLRIYNKVKKP